MELQELELELLSVTVSVTAFEPTFTQVNEEGTGIVEKIPQASFEPLLINEPLRMNDPEPFN